MAETIKLKSYANVQEEMVAAAALFPGHLIEENTNGKVQKHDSAAGVALAMFAIEDALQGKEISEAYAIDDVVRAWIPQRGDIVNAVLADGENVSVGDFLESAGDGALQSVTVDSAIVAQATEALDLSASGESSGALGADERIAVRII